MPRRLQKSPWGSSLSLLRHWLLSLHWSQWVRVPAETPRATQPSKGGLHPQGGLYGAPSLDPPESMDIPLDVYGNWTGQVWPSRGAGREETAPVFSTVCGRDVSSPLRGSHRLPWDVICPGLVLEGLLPTPRTVSYPQTM